MFVLVLHKSKISQNKDPNVSIIVKYCSYTCEGLSYVLLSVILKWSWTTTSVWLDTWQWVSNTYSLATTRYWARTPEHGPISGDLKEACQAGVPYKVWDLWLIFEKDSEVLVTWSELPTVSMSTNQVGAQPNLSYWWKLGMPENQRDKQLFLWKQ